MQGKGVLNCMTHFVAESSRCMLLRTIVTMLRMPNLFFLTHLERYLQTKNYRKNVSVI